MAHYTLVESVADAIQVQSGSIVSKTVYGDNDVKVVLMALDSGQELSEHTASMPAVIEMLAGRARVTLGEDAHELQAGAWVYMPANLKHSVLATTPTTLLLTLVKAAGRRGQSG